MTPDIVKEIADMIEIETACDPSVAEKLAWRIEHRFTNIDAAVKNAERASVEADLINAR